VNVLLEKGFVKGWDKLILIGDKTRGTQKDPLIRVITVI
jgi:hypothetical protein